MVRTKKKTCNCFFFGKFINSNSWTFFCIKVFFRIFTYDKTYMRTCCALYTCIYFIRNEKDYDSNSSYECLLLFWLLCLLPSQLLCYTITNTVLRLLWAIIHTIYHHECIMSEALNSHRPIEMEKGFLQSWGFFKCKFLQDCDGCSRPFSRDEI